MAWTTSDVRTYVLAELGYPKRRVELDQSNISEALKRAVAYYGAQKPEIKKGNLVALAGVQKYDFTALSKPYGRGLLSVYPEPITSPQAVFSEFEYYRLRTPPYVDMGELVLDQMYYKEIATITGTAPDWDWDQDSATLLITPSPTRTHGLAYEYNDPPSTIETVPAGYQGWVVDYTLAICKMMLGRIRDKFKGVPGQELPIDTDGADLLSEGKEDREKLEESLKGTRGDITPPIRG